MTKAKRKRTKSGKSYRVHWSDEDQEYVSLCAELPSISWLAKTPGTALNGIRRLVAETLVEMVR